MTIPDPQTARLETLIEDVVIITTGSPREIRVRAKLVLTRIFNMAWDGDTPDERFVESTAETLYNDFVHRHELEKPEQMAQCFADLKECDRREFKDFVRTCIEARSFRTFKQ